MIDYLHIKGYKSIKDVRVDFRPINILIGANGSGKSNLLSFFSFLDSIHFVICFLWFFAKFYTNLIDKILLMVV